MMQRSVMLLIVLIMVSLVSAPVGQTTGTATFTFTAAGDHGSGTTSNRSIAVVKNSGSSFYLALGDLSYAADGEQRWCTNFKSQFNHVEVLTGNHETGEHAGGDIDTYVKYCPFTLGSLTGVYGKQYYFDYPADTPLARFIMIAPGVGGSLGINYNVGGAGYKFTRDAIAAARSAGIKWIIVGMHKNCISIGAKTCGAGTDIMRLLLDHKVDLILQGHDHNYQRSHQLTCLTPGSFAAACVADSGSDGTYTKGAGSVILINGAFGRQLYGVNTRDSEADYFAKSNSTTWGVTKYTVTESELRGQYLRSDGGSFADSFTIHGGPRRTPTSTPRQSPTSTRTATSTPTATATIGSRTRLFVYLPLISRAAPLNDAQGHHIRLHENAPSRSQGRRAGTS